MSEQSGVWGARPWEGFALSSRQRIRGPLIRRWIGAARRRAARPMPEVPGEGADIIRLTWEQTFGRPSTPKDKPTADPI